MKPFNPVTKEVLDRMQQCVGKANVTAVREEMIDYSHDEYSMEEIRRFPEAVVKPSSPEEISSLVRLCRENRVALTPRGGGTGLCGGCVPVFGGVVLSLENMKKILEIDTNNLTATVESGLMLMDFFPAVEEKGLFFPPHPGDESATIGGVISTNAGGARAVKYGVIRNFVKGIEVVLPDGEILMLGGKCIKDSSGYSLMHLMIGSEGTLGVVTKAVIALLPPPSVMLTLVAPFDSMHDAIAAVPHMLQSKILPMAVEFVERTTAEISGEFIHKQWPCTTGNAHLMIVVDGTSDDEVMRISESLGEICLAHGALDVFVADSKEKQKTVLEIRSSIYEAMKNHMLEVLDITVPRSDIARFTDDIREVAEKSGMWLPTYGHAADGNVHTHLMRSVYRDGEWKEIDGWKDRYIAVRKALHEAGKKYRGVPSGEHGIGLVKKEYLKSFLPARQIALMRDVKKVFDPEGFLNPGKIFD